MDEDDIPLSCLSHGFFIESSQTPGFYQDVEVLREFPGILGLEEPNRFHVLLPPEDQFLFRFSLNLGLPHGNGHHQANAYQEDGEHEDDQGVAAIAAGFGLIHGA